MENRGEERSSTTSTVEALSRTTAPVVPDFSGHYYVKLEASGRVLLPSAYKGAFDGAAKLRPARDRNLSLWTPAAYQASRAKYKTSGAQGVSGPRALKLLAMTTFDVAVDKQHRFVIPPDLKARAGLGKEIVLAGALETIEIWSAEAFERDVLPLLEDPDLFFDEFEGIEGE